MNNFTAMRLTYERLNVASIAASANGAEPWRSKAMDAAMSVIESVAYMDGCREDWIDLDGEEKAKAGPVAALEGAESFIAGFEDDDTQEGVAELLSLIRAELAKL